MRCRVLLVCLFLSAGALLNPAQAQQLQFVLQRPHEPRIIFGNAWTIYADGPIDGEAAARLDRLVKEHSIPEKSTIHLNSPGGNLFGGMALGRSIRKAGLLAYVSRKGPEETIGQFKSFRSLPGDCLSACSLAYLGGKFRWIDEKSVYGVHRFYAPNKDLGSDAAQITSSMIVQYIRDMGTDAALFSEMTKAGGDEINVLSRSKLVALNVVNNGVGRTAWTVESASGALYLKGERETWRGINKFIIECDRGRPILYVIFDPEGRGDEIEMLGAQSVMIDGNLFPISSARVMKPKLINGWVNAAYALNGDLLGRIIAAKTVGIAFQAMFGAPVFLGFDGLELESGRQKLVGFLATCR